MLELQYFFGQPLPLRLKFHYDTWIFFNYYFIVLLSQ